MLITIYSVPGGTQFPEAEGSRKIIEFTLMELNRYRTERVFCIVCLIIFSGCLLTLREREREREREGEREN